MKYVLQRVGAMLITLFFVMSLSFFVVRLMPMNIFENPEVPLEVQEKLEDKFHLNDPLPVQYFYFMEGIVTGLDFGISIKLRPGLDVFPIMIERLPPTMLINFISLFISIPLGLIFGIIAALKRNTWIDHVISVLVILFISIPSFVFASVLQYVLTFKIALFPTLYDPQAVTFGEKMYILLARTKGLTRAQAIVRHAFRNSMMPITSTLVALITGIMGGSLVIENMFAIPGTGGMLTKSIFAGDHFLTIAILVFYSTISLVTILVVDLAYGLIDPRVRVGGSK